MTARVIPTVSRKTDLRAAAVRLATWPARVCLAYDIASMQIWRASLLRNGAVDEAAEISAEIEAARVRLAQLQP